MPAQELRPLIVATFLIAIALFARGLPAGERRLTFQGFCQQFLTAEPSATALTYPPCMPPQ